MKFLISDPSVNSIYTNKILEKYFVSNQSLFRFTKDEHLTSVAPFIFQIETGNLVKAITEPGATLKSYLIVESKESFEPIANHFRRFLYQKINGKEFYFRCWDSRVLKKFLPTCDAKQLKDFFGPIEKFYGEDEDPKFAVVFSKDKSDKLITEKIPAETLFSVDDEKINQETSPENKPEEKKENSDKNKKDIPPNKRFSILD